MNTRTFEKEKEPNSVATTHDCLTLKRLADVFTKAVKPNTDFFLLFNDDVRDSLHE